MELVQCNDAAARECGVVFAERRGKNEKAERKRRIMKERLNALGINNGTRKESRV